MTSLPNDPSKTNEAAFGAYSAYYDLLYRDKDYAGEAAYVQSLLARHHPEGRSILDLGCGTGRHALLLAEQGYRVCGVDLSREMLARAERQLADATPEQAARRASSGAGPSFHLGDARSARLGQAFDAVVSLFHVMSYQNTNADLTAAFETAKAHLKPGGIFVFDCWYGPAVLKLGPSVRIGRFEDDRTSVIRIAEPVLHPNRNVVDVNYQVLIKDKASGTLDELRETHCMRYLFTPEVEQLLQQVGFQLEAAVEFMTGGPLSLATWTAVFVARLPG
jgi:SAM-dependent methyltransferase